ncbi:diacylglycerol kinase family protein [Cellulomonas sp. ATA003]|uniref:diacylglycerol/lipid kinase family protein n=1 Tax=Cellulomonas sp. ATA003 TaxID=3073064 RepID=UPI002873DCE3|nr:diacylglycerol kinase family protein [Cellulomonas sp. ATA003]WNB84276.1 diacylglycerol kinase family protein [Cellulomonas sp. ATA003]
MSRLGVLVKPAAAGGRGAGTGAATVDRLRRRGHAVRVLTLGDVVRAPDADGPDADVLGTVDLDTVDLDGVVAVGGDGTVHAALPLTAGTGLPLGIVPAGSGNDVAHSLGLRPGDVDAAVRTLERALARGPRRVDAVRAGSPDATAPGRTPPGRTPPGATPPGATPPGATPPAGTAPTWYAGVLSCGLDAAVSARAHSMRHPRGPARYVRALAAELGRFAPYGYRLTLDDDVWESPGTLVAVANTPRFGGGIRIAPDARVDDGLLDVVVAGPVTRRGVAALLPGAYAGRHVSHPAVRVLRTRRVLVEAAPDLGGPPPTAYADGEPLGALPLAVELRPGALAVLA